jgi:hypothetical protein
MRNPVRAKHVPDVPSEGSFTAWHITRGEGNGTYELDEHAVEAAVRLANGRAVEVHVPVAPSAEILVAREVEPSEGARLSRAANVVAGGRGAGGECGLVWELAEIPRSRRGLVRELGDAEVAPGAKAGGVLALVAPDVCADARGTSRDGGASRLGVVGEESPAREARGAGAQDHDDEERDCDRHPLLEARPARHESSPGSPNERRYVRIPGESPHFGVNQRDRADPGVPPLSGCALGTASVLRESR